jgi:hypothetical protein
MPHTSLVIVYTSVLQRVIIPARLKKTSIVKNMAIRQHLAGHTQLDVPDAVLHRRQIPQQSTEGGESNIALSP